MRRTISMNAGPRDTMPCCARGPGAMLVVLGLCMLLHAAGSSVAGQTCTPWPSGILHWYPGEGTGEDATDIVAELGAPSNQLQPTHGKLEAGVTLAATSGKVGGAFAFPGPKGTLAHPGSYGGVGLIPFDAESPLTLISCANATCNPVSFTIEAWVNYSGPTPQVLYENGVPWDNDSQTIAILNNYCDRSPQAQGLRIINTPQSSAGKVEFLVRDQQHLFGQKYPNEVRVSSPSALTTGIYHHVVAVRDRKPPVYSKVRLYVDGWLVSEADDPTIDPLNEILVSKPNLLLGRLWRDLNANRNEPYRCPTTGIFNGLIDEVRVYRRALYDNEVRDTHDGLYMDEARDAFASAFAAGDFNNDGISDLAVGVPGESRFKHGAGGTEVLANAGNVIVYMGTADGLRLCGNFAQPSLRDWDIEADAHFGKALAAGDFNGDGITDLAVGAPGKTVGSVRSGAVYIFVGGAIGNAASVGLSISSKLTQGLGGFGSNEAGDLFGYALAAGDLNRDGTTDLAVGAPGEVLGSDPKTAQQSGFVFLFYPAPRLMAPSPGMLRGISQDGLGSNESGDLFGGSLAIGDLDGDGHPDLAVGAPGEGPGTAPATSGYVFLFHNTPSGLAPWQGVAQAPGISEKDDRFGEAIAIGNLSGDRAGDLVVGAPGENPGPGKSGYVFLFQGIQGGSSAVKSWSGLTQESLDNHGDGDLYGSTFAIGDYNGDGTADLAVGAPGDGSATTMRPGYVFVYRGGPKLSGWMLLGKTATAHQDLFGTALASGDFDGDRVLDLVVGLPGTVSSAGKLMQFEPQNGALPDTSVSQITH